MDRTEGQPHLFPEVRELFSSSEIQLRIVQAQSLLQRRKGAGYSREICRGGFGRLFDGVVRMVIIACFTSIVFGDEPRPPITSVMPRTVLRPTVEPPSSWISKEGIDISPGAIAYSMDQLDDKQKLAVGDKITLRIIEDQEEPLAQIVTDTGNIYVPELGLMPAAGKTCLQLARELKVQLEKTAYYQATVLIGIEQLNKTLSGRKVFVAGQVRITGPIEIPAGEMWTVSKIVMRAGGFTEFADKKRVRLIRGDAKLASSQVAIINVSEIWEKAAISKDVPVEPEDLIYVPARAINF